MDAVPISFRHVRANGISLHLAEAGPEDGPLVLLLHGFPEFWFGWRNQIGPLAAAGLRVVAVDQRGYNRSDKPTGVAAYDIEVLAADILSLADALGRERFSIVGHDWGGLVACWLAAESPARLGRMAVLNATHPSVWRETILDTPRQALRSVYVGVLQIPGLPEWVLRRRHFGAMARSLCRTSRPGAFSDADLDAYREAWSQPGALTSMINWYRAVPRRSWPASSTIRVDVPTLLLWGAQDSFAIPKLAERNARLCSRATLRYFEDATHWLHHEEPERVNAALLAFFAPLIDQR